MIQGGGRNAELLFPYRSSSPHRFCFRYFYVFTLGNDGPIANKETGYSYDAMVENMPQIFHTASIWLTLLLALQRYIYVCHATMARTWCTISRTKKAVACTIVVAFLHQTTR